MATHLDYIFILHFNLAPFEGLIMNGTSDNIADRRERDFPTLLDWPYSRLVARNNCLLRARREHETTGLWGHWDALVDVNWFAEFSTMEPFLFYIDWDAPRYVSKHPTFVQ